MCFFVFVLFFKAVTEAAELPVRKVIKKSAKISKFYLLGYSKIKQNATKYILNLIWFAKVCLSFC